MSLSQDPHEIMQDNIICSYNVLVFIVQHMFCFET